MTSSELLPLHSLVRKNASGTFDISWRVGGVLKLG